MQRMRSKRKRPDDGVGDGRRRQGRFPRRHGHHSRREWWQRMDRQDCLAKCLFGHGRWRRLVMLNMASEGEKENMERMSKERKKMIEMSGWQTFHRDQCQPRKKNWTNWQRWRWYWWRWYCWRWPSDRSDDEDNERLNFLKMISCLASLNEHNDNIPLNEVHRPLRLNFQCWPNRASWSCPTILK